MEPETASANAAQIELWNGRGGEIWTRLQPRLDDLFEPLTAALLSTATPEQGESIVEIGCGDLTLALAKACGPRGKIVAVDISTPMLERARSRDAALRTATPDLAPIEWRLSDAMLDHFESDADLVTSRFGVMFFAEPVAAFSNIRQALKPGGRLAVLSWACLADNPWISVPLAAVHELIESPPPLPAGSPGPFAFADPNYVRDVLAKAGFSDIRAQSVETQLILGRAEANAADKFRSAVSQALELAMESGPVAALLRTADAHFTRRCANVLQVCWCPVSTVGEARLL